MVSGRETSAVSRASCCVGTRRAVKRAGAEGWSTVTISVSCTGVGVGGVSSEHDAAAGIRASAAAVSGSRCFGCFFIFIGVTYSGYASVGH